MSDNVAGVMTPADELAIMKVRPNVFPARVVALVRSAWAEGARAGWETSTDAGFDSASYPFEETGIAETNPYKEA